MAVGFVLRIHCRGEHCSSLYFFYKFLKERKKQREIISVGITFVGIKISIEHIKALELDTICFSVKFDGFQYCTDEVIADSICDL